MTAFHLLATARLTVFCVLVVLAIPESADAEPIVLSSAPFHIGPAGAGGVEVPTPDPLFSVSAFDGTSQAISIFNVRVSESDVGKLFRATRDTDSAFGAFAVELTRADRPFFSASFAFPRSADSTFLADAFSALPPGTLATSITAVAMRLDSFRFDKIGSDSFEVEYAGQLFVEGTSSEARVPEPATLLMLCAGLGVAMRRAWRREHDN